MLRVRPHPRLSSAAARRRPPPSAAAALRQRGFSLIEVMIVLVIIGIATATVSVAAFSGGDARALRQDAQRLAQLFSVAQAEARKAGAPVVWEYDGQGYGFLQMPRDLFLPAGLARQAGLAAAGGFAGGPLRARAWTPDNAIDVRVEPAAANVFEAEWISGPLSVELRDGINTMRIVRLGNGQYQVQP